VLFPTSPHLVEARVVREDDRISAVSAATLLYMYAHGVALEERLKRHRRGLRWIAADECDLFEGMRLSARLGSVDRNIGRTEGRNERMRTEFLRRRLRNEG